MNNAEAPTRSHVTGSCTIRVNGHLEERWIAWFDGLTVTTGDDGITVIHGPVADQAALLGLLHAVRHAGLPLISVVRTDPGDSHTDPQQTPLDQT